MSFVCLYVQGTGHAKAAFEDSMAQRTLACTVCHGEQGKAGPDGYYPRLAGKPAGYLFNQLQNFRAGRRHYPLMQGLLDPLDDAYLRDIAGYFSALTLPYPPPRPATGSAEELERGRRLAQTGDRARGIPACTQCHGLLLTGVNPATPGLLGLPADYLNAQLGGWQTGQRRAAAPDCMATIAKRLSAADSHAVARWLAAQPIPVDARATEHKPRATAATLEMDCGSTQPERPASAVAPSAPVSATEVERGSYLARIGGCATCHTARGGVAYAGGRAIDTPFGAVFSSNITPDPVQGIGRWSADDFWQALHHGVSKDGHALYPAFPYTSYTHTSRADADALFAYLQSLPPSAQARPPHALRWPFNMAPALWLWRALFFTPADDLKPTAAAAGAAAMPAPGPQAQVLQRGAYLVQGLGHCMECHGSRNALGALSGSASPDGFVLPGSLWWAPSLSDASGAAGWSEADITSFLTQGRNSKAQANGPMAEVVLHGTQYLSAADARAMAVYLKSQAQPTPARQAAATPARAATPVKGARLYEDRCADCHGLQGQGRAGVYPALAGNRAVTAVPANNLIHLVLGGGFAPATASHPRPFGMPPFMLQLRDADIAAVLSYIRNAWGNQAPAVTEFDINKFSRTQSP